MKSSPRTVYLLILMVWLWPGPGSAPAAGGDPLAPDENRRTLADYDLIGDYLQERLCLFYEKNKEPRLGGECFETLYRSYPDSPLRAGALFHSARLHGEAGDLPRSRELFHAFLREYPGNRRTPEARLNLGRIAWEEESYREAGDAFRKVWVDHPASSAAETAGDYLEEVRRKVPDYPGLTLTERLQRAEGLYDSGAYVKAVTAYRELLESGKLRGKAREDAAFRIARSHDSLREWGAADGEYRNYLKRYPDGQYAGAALFRSGRIALRLHKEEDYLKAHRRYLKHYPSGKYRHEIRYGLTLFYVERGDVERATAALDRIREEDPHGEWGAKALWEKGWFAYRRGEYAGALAPWSRLTSDPGFRPMALYWKGRSLERMGNPEAENHFISLCNQYPRSYYCLTARGEIFGDPEDKIGVRVQFSNWKLHSDPNFVLPDLPVEIRSHPRYPRIAALARVGWFPEAAREARGLRKEFAEDRSRLLSLAYFLLRLGDTPHALDIVQTHFSSEIVQGGMETDLPFQRIAFPLDYADRLASDAEPLGLDPSLAAALIREESWYNPEAVSPAGAVGLMQIMPATARRLLAAVPDPPSPPGNVSTLLTDPEWNIRLGVRFLADMLARFNGEIVFAVAAYNAGPGAVDRWIRTIPAETPDEFVESIPYPETRRYVKRVLRSYAEYRRAF